MHACTKKDIGGVSSVCQASPGPCSNGDDFAAAQEQAGELRGEEGRGRGRGSRASSLHLGFVKGSGVRFNEPAAAEKPSPLATLPQDPFGRRGSDEY